VLIDNSYCIVSYRDSGHKLQDFVDLEPVSTINTLKNIKLGRSHVSAIVVMLDQSKVAEIAHFEALPKFYALVRRTP